MADVRLGHRPPPRVLGGSPDGGRSRVSTSTRWRSRTRSSRVPRAHRKRPRRPGSTARLNPQMANDPVSTNNRWTGRRSQLLSPPDRPGRAGQGHPVSERVRGPWRRRHTGVSRRPLRHGASMSSPPMRLLARLRAVAGTGRSGQGRVRTGHPPEPGRAGLWPRQSRWHSSTVLGHAVARQGV